MPNGLGLGSSSVSLSLGVSLLLLFSFRSLQSKYLILYRSLRQVLANYSTWIPNFSCKKVCTISGTSSISVVKHSQVWSASASYPSHFTSKEYLKCTFEFGCLFSCRISKNRSTFVITSQDDICSLSEIFKIKIPLQNSLF